MKKTLILLIFLPILAFGQLMVSGGVSVSSLLPIIADSTLWHLQGTDTLVTDGALPIKVSGLRVSGTTRLDGTLTMNTIATEQVKLGTGSDAAPELSSAGDTNTGIRFPGGDKVQLVQNGINSHTFRPYRYTLTYSDGDTGSLFLDGTYLAIQSKENLYIGFGNNRLQFVGNIIYPSVNDIVLFGLPTAKIKEFNISDYINIGGKGQTATMYVSGENTIAGSDSSWTMSAASGVPTLEAKFALPAASYSNGGRRTYFGADTLALFNGARTGRDSTTFVLPSGKLVAATLQIGASNFTTTKVDTIFSAGYVPRWVKFTSGAKSWYSPVYADTTGKW